MFGHSADWKAANPNGDGITQPSQIGQSQRDCITKPKGCAPRATLGLCPHIFPTLKGLQPHPSAAHSHRHTAIAGQDSRAYGLLHQSAIDDREGKDRCNPFQG